MGESRNIKECCVFQAVSSYQLLEIIVFKELYKKNKDGILFVPKWLLNKIVNIKIIGEYFKQIVVFDFLPDYGSPDVSQEIVRYYDNLLNEENVNLLAISEIYVAGAHYGLGSYLCNIGKTFIFLEDAAGILSNTHILFDIEQGINPDRNNYNYNLGLYDGSNCNVIKIIANRQAQNGNIKKDFFDFDVVREIGRLDDKTRKSILQIFSKSTEIHIEKNSSLLLTEHFANCKRTSFEGQIEIYQLVVDYFVDGNALIIKPHPDDLMYYGRLFQNSKIIRERFPAEFIPYIFDNKPQQLITVSSAAVKNLRDTFDKIIYLGNNFEKNYKSIHKKYVAIYLAKHFASKCNISFINCDNNICDIFLENIDADSDSNECNVVVIDDYGEVDLDVIHDMIDHSDENLILIFVNSEDEFFKYTSIDGLWDKMIPFKFSKNQLDELKEEFYSDCLAESLYIYCANSKLRERLANMKIEKKLENTNIVLRDQMDENLEIAILKAKLEATEKRLLYYIDLYEKEGHSCE